MAKDKGGHGSEARGTHPADAAYASRQNLARERVVPALLGSVTADIRNQNGIASNAQAAAALANDHPKSDPVPVHSGATGRSGNTGPVVWDKMNPVHDQAAFTKHLRTSGWYGGRK